jgi:hypothetical protein
VHVIASEVTGSKINLKVKRNQKLINYNESLHEEEPVEKVEALNTHDYVRLVEKFTCNFAPKVKLTCKAFPNNTFPLVTMLKPEEIKIDHMLP